MPSSSGSSISRSPRRRASERRALWRAAMATINADAPGIFLYSLENVAAVHKRFDNVQIRPDSWRRCCAPGAFPPDRLIDRDRVER